MVHDQKTVIAIDLDDRVVLPPRDKMDPELKKKCDEAYSAVARKLGWDKPSK